MSTAQSKLEAMLAMNLYQARSEEIKRYLAELSREYGPPKLTVKEVRAMLDKALGKRTLSEEIYQMREEAF